MYWKLFHSFVYSKSERTNIISFHFIIIMGRYSHRYVNNCSRNEELERRQSFGNQPYREWLHCNNQELESNHFHRSNLTSPILTPFLHHTSLGSWSNLSQVISPQILYNPMGLSLPLLDSSSLSALSLPQSHITSAKI